VSSETITAPVDSPSITPSTSNNDGNHDKFAHIVIGGTDAVVNAMVTGEPVTALCGKVWVPGSNGAGFDMCPTCEEIGKHIDPSRMQNW